jgi:hypothetical protein
MSVDAIYKLTLAARIFETALRFPAGSSQNALLPEARTVDLYVDGSMMFPHPRRASPSWGRPFLILEALMKNRLAVYKALKAINVPEQKIEAVIQAMDSDMHLSTAGTSDSDFAQFRAELSRLRVSLTIDIGVMLSLAVATLFAGMAFIH